MINEIKRALKEMGLYNNVKSVKKTNGKTSAKYSEIYEIKFKQHDDKVNIFVECWNKEDVKHLNIKKIVEHDIKGLEKIFV